MKISLLSLLFLGSVAHAATGYRLVHPDGSVEFTDQPISGGEEIELREAPTIQFSPVAPSSTDSRSKKGVTDNKSAEGTASITVTSPRDGETVWFDGSGVTVSISVSPALKAEQNIVISLDGKEATRGSGSNFTLGGVTRGSHTLSAGVIGAGGAVLFRSTPISFHVRQHTVIKQP
jgi:hypothetical protein